MSTTIESLLQTHNVEYRTRHRDVRAKFIGLVCPFCGKPGEYYLGISTEYLGVNCWRCGSHKLRDVLKHCGVPSHAITQLYDSHFAGLGSDRTKERDTGAYKPPRVIPLIDAPRVFRDYVQGRKLDPAELGESWGVQAIMPPDKYAWRLFIPITERGRSVSWTTRSIDAQAYVRYLTAPPEREAKPGRELLYGADYCGHAIIVVEGPVDAWRIGPGAVATMGLTLSREQMSAIGKYPVRVIAFDNEPEAQKRAKKLYRRLSEYDGQTHRYVFQSNDAGSASDREITKLRKEYL